MVQDCKQADDLLNLPDDMPKQDKLIILLPHCESVKQAALLAGYSESTARGSIHTLIKTPAFQSKLREHYNGQAHMLLPSILRVEQNVVKACLDDVNCVPKFQHTLKQIKQSTSVLQPDPGHGNVTINVGNIQDLMLQVCNKRNDTLHNDRAIDQSDINCHSLDDDKIVDAETV